MDTSDDKRVTLRLGRRLTPNVFEQTLYGASPVTKAAKGWTRRVTEGGLFIDLSKVEFAEFTALGQVALLIEGAARHGVLVKIAIPLDRSRVGERTFADRCSMSVDARIKRLADGVLKRVETRAHALKFMQRCGFLDAIRVPHVPDACRLVEILTDYDSTASDGQVDLPDEQAGGTTAESEIDEDSNYYLLSRIFPLKWYDPAIRRAFEGSQHFAAFILHGNALGLSEVDAKAVAGNILGELVENVHVHAHEKGACACHPHALLGAILLDPKRYLVRKDSYRACMGGFLAWVQQQSSPLIRIVVGDSGRGIPEVLGPHFTRRNEEEVPKLDPPLREAEKVLFWAFNRWSTSNPEAALTKRGTRGLWLVQRIVRAYGGSITLRSEDAMVGWAYPADGDVAPLRDQGLRFVPGTFVETCITTRNRPLESLSTTGTAHDSSHETEAVIVRCHGNSDADVSEDDQVRLIAEFAKATPMTYRLVIGTVEVRRPSARATEDTLVDIIRSASSLPNQGALALLLTGCAPANVVGAAESIDIARDEMTPATLEGLGVPRKAEPVLLIDSRGGATWFAGDRPTRLALKALLRAPEWRLSYEALIQEAGLQDRQSDFLHWLRDHADIIKSSPDGVVALRWTPGTIQTSMEAHIDGILKRAVETGLCEGVDKGVFLTPTLGFVNRWIQVERLVEAQIGVRNAAYMLARKLQREVAAASQIASVVRMEPSCVGLAAALGECLGAEKTPYAISGGLEAYGADTGVAAMPGDTRPVLCTDLVLTGYSLTQVIVDLTRRNIKPIAVACVIDARPHRTPDVLGIPLVSLTEVNISISEPTQNEHFTAIDPVLREPLRQKSSGKATIPSYKIDPSDVLGWCEKEEPRNVLCFGHIERDVGRHFVAYLNAGRLIRENPQASQIIISTTAAHAMRWVDDRMAQDKQRGTEVPQAIEIWYPGSSRDFAGQIALAAAEEIRGTRASVYSVRTREIARVAFGGKWVFPTCVDPILGNVHVVMVDWGSITALTVEQIMRLAGEAGAASFKAIVFLSQMPVEDEMALRRIRAICSSQLQMNTLGGESAFSELPLFSETTECSAPAEVEFLSQLRLGWFSRAECPICKRRIALLSEAEHTPTELLRQHASTTAALLMPRPREEVFAQEQRDLYNEPLAGADIASIIKLRQRLEEALRSTHVRLGLYNDLLTLDSTRCPSEIIAWIRLLSTEPAWLRLPPLCFDPLREMLATLALTVALDERSDGKAFGEAGRRQAIMTLAAASEATFVKHLPETLRRCAHERALASQILYETYILLQRCHAGVSDLLKDIHEGLIKCRDYLAGSAAEGELPLELELTTRSLLRASDFLFLASGKSTSTVKEAWKALHDSYLRPMMSHHPVVEATFDILIPFQQPTSGNDVPSPQLWQHALHSWELCQDFLSANVFPYLAALRVMLFHEFYSSQMTPDELERYGLFIKQVMPYQMGKLSGLLYDFCRQPAHFRDAQKREEVKREWAWWYQFLLKRGFTAKPAVEAARLMRFLEGCPCTVEEALALAIEHEKAKGYPFEIVPYDKSALEIRVFCDKDLLTHAFTHLVDNAVGPKHRLRGRSSSNKNKVSVILHNDKADQSQLHIEVRNDGTVVTVPAGRGLQTLNASLNVFAGRIRGAPVSSNDAGWTYAAELELERW